MRGIPLGCCARVASGHAAAAPPSSEFLQALHQFPDPRLTFWIVMNSRRLSCAA